MPSLDWNPRLIHKYNMNGPRYTSYPTALELQSEFNTQRVGQALLATDDPLSLYLHIPFCHQLCYYCGCNRVITRHAEKADLYLAKLAADMRLYAPYIRHRPLRNLHLGGGTPTFLSTDQLSELMQLLQHTLGFEARDANEISIEIDPRSCSAQKLAHLRELGFNRVSFGVQDFDQHVQTAINRVQSFELVAELVQLARQLEFESINLDLVYGLPKQDHQVFEHSLKQVVALAPDRVSLFSYAHMPSRFAAQRRIADDDLLQGAAKQALLLKGIEQLTNAGYQFIGMDHFAKPNDSLAQAQQQGRLQRNFQGYTTHGDNALLGLGVSSISQVNGVIWQHEKDLQPYYQALNQQQLPVLRGITLTHDDAIRGALISELICHFKLNTRDFGTKWEIEFEDYFASELESLAPFIADDLIRWQEQTLEVTPQGRLWVRTLCATFDAYLQQQTNHYSQVV